MWLRSSFLGSMARMDFLVVWWGCEKLVSWLCMQVVEVRWVSGCSMRKFRNFRFWREYCLLGRFWFMPCTCAKGVGMMNVQYNLLDKGLCSCRESSHGLMCMVAYLDEVPCNWYGELAWVKKVRARLHNAGFMVSRVKELGSVCRILLVMIWAFNQKK